jgi:cardiolipin synthase
MATNGDANWLHFWPDVPLLGLLHVVIVALVIPAVLLTKKDSTSALAWCMAVILLPFLGSLLFWEFGYNYLYRVSRRRREHSDEFRAEHPSSCGRALRGSTAEVAEGHELARLASRADAFPLSGGNAVALYHDTQAAFDALLAAIGQAKQHVHAEFFILRDDPTGKRFIEALRERARAGVQVRLLYDAWGSLRLKRQLLAPLLDAGGEVQAFLPLSPLRSRLHFNLRNHRKIVVIDGRRGFTGGMNVGDEYLGHSLYFGYWRDTFARIEGPAVADLQSIFCEDWSFSERGALNGPDYFPELEPVGEDLVQIAASGPDQDVNCIREIYLMGILGARRRLWMASPYFIPDQGLMDALRIARYRGVDVRLLTIHRPDHYLSFYAGRYYWSDLLSLGVGLYQYQKGMMHSKLMLVDGQWGMLGSANLDYRSLRLNFEVGCMLYTPRRVAELEAAFEADLRNSEPVDFQKFSARPLVTRVLENGCRLLTPNL